MARRRHLLVALADPGFRRLYAVRLTSQFGDGVFQASLAGAVLFNPERQAHAADIAAGFAVLLLPYSLIGPFAGVLLDRWSRQRILTLANVARAVGVLGFAAEVAAGVDGAALYASALVVVSVSRFVLSALSAALPHVVPAPELVTANALSTTSGTLVAAVGGAAAIGVRVLLGDSDGAYGVTAAVAALPYLAAALAATGFARGALGPSDAERGGRETARDVLHGLVAGARHVRQHRPVLYGLGAVGLHRLGYGVSTVCTLLLYRNYFHDDGFFRAGLTGLSQVVVAVAAGGALAAALTPVAFRRIGPVRWPAGLLAGAAVAEFGLGLPYTMPLLLLAGFILGFVAQAIKISVDTLVQQQVATSSGAGCSRSTTPCSTSRWSPPRRSPPPSCPRTGTRPPRSSSLRRGTRSPRRATCDSPAECSPWPAARQQLSAYQARSSSTARSWASGPCSIRSSSRYL